MNLSESRPQPRQLPNSLVFKANNLMDILTNSPVSMAKGHKDILTTIIPPPAVLLTLGAFNQIHNSLIRAAHCLKDILTNSLVSTA